ncbi:exo-alpha-sialidase [Maribacter sp.]|nr:exo-alpha-sialidase [Maribacter sp.]
MNYKALVFLSLFLLNCQSNNDSSQSAAIDTKTIANGLTLFGENIIASPLYERDMAISPEGNQLIYTLGDYKQNKRCLVVLNQENGNWSKAEILNISGKHQDIEPFFSPSGDRLYFASNRPIYNDETRNDYNIWFSDNSEGVWTEPIALDSIINTRGDEFYPSLSAKGNLFFTATRANGIGKEDIFMSKLVDGSYQSPVPLPIEINSAAFEFNAYINPAEDLIIFSSFGREDGFGGGDLYISRKDTAGKWSKSKNLGALVNSDKLDYCPFVDWKSRNFYFTSERISLDDKELVNISEVKERANSALNGFGNIYKIGFDKLE